MDDVLAWFDRFCHDPDDRVRRATYDLSGRELTRGQVEERLGAYRSWLPGLPQIQDATLEYAVGLPGLPYTCALCAGFWEGGDHLVVPEQDHVVRWLTAERARVFPPGEAHPGMDTLPDLVLDWAGRMCSIPAGTPEQAAAALGIEGTLRPFARDFLVESLPPGVAEVCLSLRQDAPVKRDDLLCRMGIALLDSTLTRADLEARFGRGRRAPRLHPGDDHRIGYHLDVAGASYSCNVSAHFETDPTMESVVHEVILRREKAPAAPRTDESALAATIDRIRGLVSFEPGGAPSYYWLDDVFITGSRLIGTGAGGPMTSTVELFIVDMQQAFDSGRLTSFRLTEITARTEIFGNIAHRLSTYQKQGVRDGVPFDGRGLASIQFVWDLDDWRISSMAWDDERPPGPSGPHGPTRTSDGRRPE